MAHVGRQLTEQKGPMSKYRNIPETIDGIRFASKREGKRYLELKLLERAKQISGLTLQPRYELVVRGFHKDSVYAKAAIYIGDFAYLENGKAICEDCKGFRTAEYKLKKRLFAICFPHIVHRET